MSHLLKNLNQKYYIALGIGIALISLILLFIQYIYLMFYPLYLTGAIVALFLLIIALANIVSKTFTTNVYKSIISLISISLIFSLLQVWWFLQVWGFFNINMIIVIVVCVVVLWYTLTVKKREEARPQEEISPQQKIAQREQNILIIKFAVGGGLIVIGIVGAIYSLTGIGGLGVTDLNNIAGYLLLGILLGPPIIVFVVPGYFLVRSAYRKYYLSKH